MVQDIFLTDTAKVAHVVLPGTASWCESEGTVTNSERRVQRVRKAIDPPAGARDDIEIICELARRLGTDWGSPRAEDLWNELRTLSPDAPRHELRAARAARRHPVAVPGRGVARARLFLHARLWEDDPVKRARRPRSTRWSRRTRSTSSTDEYPIRLTTGRRLDSYNTGVQTGHYSTPLRRPETLDLSPEDAAELGFAEGELVRVSSRRGSVTAPVHVDRILRRAWRS